MSRKSNDRGILYDENVQLGPFPLHRLKYVDKPTTIVTDDIPRFKASEEAYMKAIKGEYGPAVQKASETFMPDKYPLSKAQWEVLGRMGSCRPDPVAPEKAPITEDPKILSRHMKRLGYFLGAEVVEMEHNRGNSICCGNPPSPNLKPPVSKKMSAERIAEAEEQEVDALVVNCVGCLSLSRASLEKGIETYHLVELVQMAIGEEPVHRINETLNNIDKTIMGEMKENFQILMTRYIAEKGKFCSVTNNRL